MQLAAKRGNTEENFQRKKIPVDIWAHLTSKRQVNRGNGSFEWRMYFFFGDFLLAQQLILSIRLALTASAKKLLSPVTSHRHLFASCDCQSFAFIQQNANDLSSCPPSPLCLSDGAKMNRWILLVPLSSAIG
jgi:hypothetical protein